MNRTLLVEEGDDEGTDNRLDKKKKDKEKLQEIAGGYKCLSNIKVINHDRFQKCKEKALYEILEGYLHCLVN